MHENLNFITIIATFWHEMLKISYRNSDVSFDIANALKANFDMEMLIVISYWDIFRDASVANLDMKIVIVTTCKNIFANASIAILDMEMMICIARSFLGYSMLLKFILHFTTINISRNVLAIDNVCAYCLKTMSAKLQKCMKI